jgi:mannose-6-phosphate isomerase-like protein (cupin superfamily)
MIVPSGGGLSFEDGPDRGRIVVSGEDTGGRYALMEWTVAPAEAGCAPASYGPHRHDACEETFLIRSGTLEFLLGDQVTTMGPGDFVRVPPGLRHGYRNVSGEAVEMMVGFHPAGLEMLFVKYRSDQSSPPAGEGFVADATRFHASVFEP